MATIPEKETYIEEHQEGGLVWKVNSLWEDSKRTNLRVTEISMVSEEWMQNEEIGLVARDKEDVRYYGMNGECSRMGQLACIPFEAEIQPQIRSMKIIDEITNGSGKVVGDYWEQGCNCTRYCKDTGQGAMKGEGACDVMEYLRIGYFDETKSDPNVVAKAPMRDGVLWKIERAGSDMETVIFVLVESTVDNNFMVIRDCNASEGPMLLMLHGVTMFIDVEPT
ncbi:hypothetical protein V6N13_099975 [Hibiscus sabdariffa]